MRAAWWILKQIIMQGQKVRISRPPKPANQIGSQIEFHFNTPTQSRCESVKNRIGTRRVKAEITTFQTLHYRTIGPFFCSNSGVRPLGTGEGDGEGGTLRARAVQYCRKSCPSREGWPLSCEAHLAADRWRLMQFATNVPPFHSKPGEGGIVKGRQGVGTCLTRRTPTLEPEESGSVVM